MVQFSGWLTKSHFQSIMQVDHTIDGSGPKEREALFLRGKHDQMYASRVLRSQERQNRNF